MRWSAHYLHGGKRAIFVKGMREETGLGCSRGYSATPLTGSLFPTASFILHQVPGFRHKHLCSFFDFMTLPHQLLALCVASSCFHDSAFSSAAHPSSKHNLIYCDFLIYLIFMTARKEFTEEKIHPRLLISNILPPAWGVLEPQIARY